MPDTVLNVRVDFQHLSAPFEYVFLFNKQQLILLTFARNSLRFAGEGGVLAVQRLNRRFYDTCRQSEYCVVNAPTGFWRVEVSIESSRYILLTF